MTPPDWQPDELTLFDDPAGRWGRRLLVLMALSLALGIPLALDGYELAGVLIAIIGGTFGLTLGLAFTLIGHANRTRLDALRAGAVFARWRIDRDRWMTWHAERRRGARIATRIVTGLLAIVVIVTAALLYSDDEATLAGYVLLIGLGLAAALDLTLRQFLVSPQTPRGPTVPLIIGGHGALTLGAHLQWSALGATFDDATVDPEPPTLIVRYTTRSQHGAHQLTLALPVPRDHLDDAHRVAAALNATPR